MILRQYKTRLKRHLKRCEALMLWARRMKGLLNRSCLLYYASATVEKERSSFGNLVIWVNFEQGAGVQRQEGSRPHNEWSVSSS